MAVGIAYCTAFIALPLLASIGFHCTLHSFNLIHAGLALFQLINILICIWEQALFFEQAKVQREHAGFQKKYGNKGVLPNPIILFRNMSLSEALTFNTWTEIWSTYAQIDESYVDEKSFGFWIDTGNGLTTIIPSILFGVGMTWDILSPKLFATVGIVTHYQELYGTVLYFSSFFYNGRHKNQPFSNNMLVVCSNGLWILVPSFAMYVSWVILQEESFQFVR
eukprot:m.76298 g.76298  ORF g.76298 m.76298 type:complete len:222 (+) comp12550_c0_seq2:311-976(+)